MSCSGAYASADDFASFWCLDTPLDAAEEAALETFLELAAGDIHAARAASGGCDCTLAGWAADFLKKLNVIEAAVIHNCPCQSARLSDAMKPTWLEWITNQMELIRTGKLELCDGETGSEYPAFGWAEMGVTEFNQARIIYNRQLREG